MQTVLLTYPPCLVPRRLK